MHVNIHMHALYVSIMSMLDLHAWQVTPVVPGNYHERQALQAEFKRPFLHAMDKEICNHNIIYNPFQSVFDFMFIPIRH